MRPSWDFDYAPARGLARSEPTADHDVIVATARPVAESRIAGALASSSSADLRIDTLIDRCPVHWTRIRAARPLSFREIGMRLTAAGVEVRYVASATQPSQELPPPLPLDGPSAAPSAWSARHEPIGRDPSGPGAWYLSELGLDVDRALAGYGIGTRVAIIDNDAGKTDLLGLDALVAVGRELPDPRRHIHHGASCVGWAVGVAALGHAGIAPGASARLYCIPKAGEDVFAFPLAIVQAAADGADVIGCATYVDETTSPMLDDALTFARRYGRGGLGSPVVLAASREMSSPEGRVRASLSLDLGDPVSDPRVMCAAASGEAGSWFLWRDKAGELQPFSNRGPAVRFMAPGADVTNPLAPERVAHAESSGATAFSVGVAALVLAHNPTLSACELAEILRLSARPVAPDLDRRAAAERRAGESELLPFGVDPDGHNAKHGYGRLDATVACIVARDPVALGLLRLGERDALVRWATRARAAGLVSRATCLAACRLLLADGDAGHQLVTLLRHLRLVARSPDERAHTRGALTRLAAVMLRTFADRAGGGDSELDAVARDLAERTRSPDASAGFEEALTRMAVDLWPRATASPPHCDSATHARAS